MSSPIEQYPVDLHHYPPTTADWVTSPLESEDEIPPNPLEPESERMASVRFGALLLIGGGLLALAGLISQFNQLVDFRFVMVAVLTAGAALLAVGAAARGVVLLIRQTDVRDINQAVSLALTGAVLQIASVVVTAVLPASGNQPMFTSPGSEVAGASLLCLLVGGCILRFIGQQELSRQERAAQAKSDESWAGSHREGKLPHGIPWGNREITF